MKQSDIIAFYLIFRQIRDFIQFLFIYSQEQLYCHVDTTHLNFITTETLKLFLNTL